MIYEERLLKSVSKAGRILLESGAEIYRVEETINRVLNCLQVEEGSAFVTPSGVFVSFISDGKTYSKVVRVTSSSLNLTRINEINQASRDICGGLIGLDEFEERVRVCSHKDFNTPTLDCWYSAIIAMSFTIFYGGLLWDGVAGFIAGFLVRRGQIYFSKKKLNSFVAIGLCSALIVLFACIFSTLPIPFQRDVMIIGSMMLLVPGLAFTNAIRDCFAGDYLSALTRATEAILIAISLAVGAGIVLSLWMLGGGV